MSTERYQYAAALSFLDREGVTIRKAISRHYAEIEARDWAISPARTGPRMGQVVRRRGWEGDWEPVASWKSPEAER